MQRRTFLRSLVVTAGALGVGPALTACGGGEGAIPDGSPELNVVNPSFEVLAGDARRVNLVVSDLANEPVTSGEVQVYVRALPEEGGEVRSGPHAATFHDNVDQSTGLGTSVWQAAVPLTAGVQEVVAVAGGRYGASALNVVAPEDAQAPIPGDIAVSTPTPTTADDLGYERVCTQDPPCGMHEDSLEALLAAERPVVLAFATPAYCVSVACGPTVANLDRVRQSRDWGDVAFVHCEIYPSEAEAQKEVGPPVQAWDLPTEPWVFAIGADGRIVDRIDGAMLAEDMQLLAEQVA